MRQVGWGKPSAEATLSAPGQEEHTGEDRGRGDEAGGRGVEAEGQGVEAKGWEVEVGGRGIVAGGPGFETGGPQWSTQIVGPPFWPASPAGPFSVPSPPIHTPGSGFFAVGHPPPSTGVHNVEPTMGPSPLACQRPPRIIGEIIGPYLSGFISRTDVSYCPDLTHPSNKPVLITGACVLKLDAHTEKSNS